MSWQSFDEDEWEVVSFHRPCTACQGDMRKCNGMCNGSSGYSQNRRAPEDIARIKAARRQKEEDEILRRADAIRAARSSVAPSA